MDLYLVDSKLVYSIGNFLSEESFEKIILSDRLTPNKWYFVELYHLAEGGLVFLHIPNGNYI